MSGKCGKIPLQSRYCKSTLGGESENRQAYYPEEENDKKNLISLYRYFDKCSVNKIIKKGKE